MEAIQRLHGASRPLGSDAFMPSSVIERLVLQVIGGWEHVKAEVNFHSFAVAGFGADWTGEGSPVSAMNKIAKAERVRYPHDEFSTVANEVNNVRRRFAHLVALGDTIGEFPNRTLHFMRLGEPTETYRSRGATVGLKWRDEQWAMQSFHQDAITEQELRDTLTKEQWMVQVCRAVNRLGGILADQPDLPDDHEVGTDCNWLSRTNLAGGSHGCSPNGYGRVGRHCTFSTCAYRRRLRKASGEPPRAAAYATSTRSMNCPVPRFSRAE
jgi:hypothetical protein